MGVCVPIDFIWFDLGYTLLYIKREEPFRAVLAEFGIDRSLDEIDKAFHRVAKLFMREYPGVLGRKTENYLPWYVGFLCHYLDIRGDVFAICVRWMDVWRNLSPLWHAYGNVHDVLDCLVAKGLSLGVISNWDPSAKPILASYGLLDYFNPCIISSEVGVSKPSREIFRLALDRAKADPSRCLYVGDNYYDDAVGAASVGMKCLIVNRFGTFGVEELASQPLIRDISGIIPFLEREKA